MEFSDFQEEAAKTDQVGCDEQNSILVPLLGLAGEVGTLLSAYKKYLRDGGAHERFHDQVGEDLGDLLWYVANVASKFNLELDAIASQNLKKVRDRWPVRTAETQTGLFDSSNDHLLDVSFPVKEQIPRTFEVKIEEVWEKGEAKVVVRRNGIPIGNQLTDNAPEDDGYRFHDVFHFSYAAILGWSPIVRKLLNIKRRSVKHFDEVEDGARAAIIEELISQLVFQYAREHNFLEGINTLDYHLLRTIHSLVQDREVGSRKLFEWETAILEGYRIWRQVYANRGGVVRLDLVRREIEYQRE